MSVSKNLNRHKFFNISILFFLCIIVNSCRPALGSSWYPHSALGTENKTITIKSITIKGVTIYPEENGEDFIGRVNVTDSELFPEDIEVFAVDKKNKKIDVSVIVKGEGGQAHLQEGISVMVPIKIRDKNNPNIEVQKFLFLEQDSSMGGGGSDYNPKDPHGNSKFIIKIKTEHMEVDPWVYYRDGAPDIYDTDNFSADKFDAWILNMTSIDSKDVASYIFKPGTWQGENPAICSGPQISPGALNSAWDLRYYMYTSRFERWKDEKENGFNPNLNSGEEEKEKRFVFFKFTGKATGSSLNNSMFCLDKYSKFLFFYSEPAKKRKLLGHYIPSDWQDYAAPDKGVHVQSNIPFYETDPVGFVKEDGSVVIYEQAKTNIANAEYGPMQNPKYTEPAGKKSNKEGFSPYRKSTITIIKKKLIKTPNLKYTAVKPVISEQPKDKYAKLNSPELVFEVKTASVPEGETLSYQWYKADTRTGAGTEITGATEASYKITDTSAELKCYFYCIVKNTNTDNNKSEQTESERAKCHITDGQIQSDALNPEITEQPKSKTLRLNSTDPLTLKVKAVSKDGGTLSYQWYKAASSETEGTAESGADKSEYTFTPDTSTAGITYYYCVVTNKNNTVQGEQSASKKSAYAAIEVEASYKVEFFVAGEEGGTLTALHNGKPIKSGDYIRKGEKIKFVASPESGFYVKEWAGINPVQGLQDMTLAELVVDNNANISISFERRMRLTITPKIYNESLQSWSSESVANHDDPKYIDGVHISHKCAAQVSGVGNDIPETWNYMFPIKNKSGKWVMVERKDFINIGTAKSVETGWVNTEFSSFEGLKISLTNYLLKANRHDFWYAEWTTGLWYTPTVYPLQAIDDNSIFPLVYNENTGMWTVDKDNVQVKRSDNIPLPAEFAGTKPKPNRKISYKGVTITYDENFTLADGEEKDFVITYEVDNHDETRSKGKIKVIYTISWK